MTYVSPEGEHWYAVARHGGRTALLLGPYANHSEAAPTVDVARGYVRVALPDDDEAHFAEYGVARVVTARPPAAQFTADGRRRTPAEVRGLRSTPIDRGEAP